MDDSSQVGVREPVCGLRTDPDRLPRRESSTSGQHVEEAPPLEVLDDEVGTVFPLAPVEDAEHVGMVEGGDCPRLGPKAAEERLVAGEGRLEDLHRNAPLQHNVLGEEDMC